MKKEELCALEEAQPLPLTGAKRPRTPRGSNPNMGPRRRWAHDNAEAYRKDHDARRITVTLGEHRELLRRIANLPSVTSRPSYDGNQTQVLRDLLDAAALKHGLTPVLQKPDTNYARAYVPPKDRDPRKKPDRRSNYMLADYAALMNHLVTKTGAANRSELLRNLIDDHAKSLGMAEAVPS